jgi:hypothetical protein
MVKNIVIKYDEFYYIITPDKKSYKLILIENNLKYKFILALDGDYNEAKYNNYEVINSYDYIHSAISDFLYSNFSQKSEYKKYSLHFQMPNSDVILGKLLFESIESDITIKKVEYQGKNLCLIEVMKEL